MKNTRILFSLSSLFMMMNRTSTYSVRLFPFLRNEKCRFSSRMGIYMKTRGCGVFGERSMVPSYLPKSENQKRFVEALDNVDNKMVIVLGPAGTGKTLFACLKAIKDLKAGIVSRIVITRPVVTVEEDIGFLPGNVRNKMDPWIRPIFDIFLEFYSQRDLDAMVQSGVIERTSRSLCRE